MEKTGMTSYFEKTEGSFKKKISSAEILEFVAAFLLGKTVLFGSLLPFGAAFAAAYLNRGKIQLVKKILLIAMSLVGSVMSGVFAGKYLVCYIMISIIYSFMSLVPGEKSDFSVSFVSGISVFLSGIIFFASDGDGLYGVVMLFTESLICAASSYILAKAFSPAEKAADDSYKISLAVTAVICCMGVAGTTFGGVNFGVSLAVAFIMLTAEKRGAFVASTVGTIIGMICGFYYNPLPEIVGAFAVYGFLGGTVKRLGRAGIALMFFMANSLMSFFFGGFNSCIPDTAEAAIAIALFLMVPKTFADEADIIIASEFSSVKSSKFISERLLKLAKAFGNLSDTFIDIANRSKVSENNDFTDIFNKTANKICRKCNLKFVCWEKDFDATYESLLRIIPILKSDGRVKATDFNSSFLKKCVKTGEFSDELSRTYKEELLDIKWQQRIAESQQLTAQQFFGVSQIMEQLSFDFYNGMESEAFPEKLINLELERNGIRNPETVVVKNNSGRYEVSVCTVEEVPLLLLEKIISDATDRKLYVKGTEKVDKNTVYYAVEKERYSAFDGISSVSKKQDEECGDAYDSIALGDGKFLSVLSDGMGSGAEAAEQSKTAVTLVRQLVDAGFSNQNTVGIVNSALLSKDSAECFATLDMSIIDLFNGKTEFLKIGAASSYIKHNDIITEITSSSFPAGILNSVDITVAEHKISDGDCVIMMSDGITNQEEEWILDFLKTLKTDDAQTAADEILKEAKKRTSPENSDDMTVAVIKIKEN